MALTEQEVKLKVLRPGMKQDVYAVQADTGRSLRCTITDWTIPSGATAVIYTKKPSSKIVYNSCTVDTSTNSVVVTLTNQMLAESGLTAAMVEITSDGSVVTSFCFGIVVESKITGGTESTSESTVLEELLAELAAGVNEATQNAIETMTEATEAAIESMNEAAEAAIEQVLASVNQITFAINEDDLGLDVTVSE